MKLFETIAVRVIGGLNQYWFDPGVLRPGCGGRFHSPYPPLWLAVNLGSESYEGREWPAYDGWVIQGRNPDDCLSGVIPGGLSGEQRRRIKYHYSPDRRAALPRWFRNVDANERGRFLREYIPELLSAGPQHNLICASSSYLDTFRVEPDTAKLNDECECVVIRHDEIENIDLYADEYQPDSVSCRDIEDDNASSWILIRTPRIKWRKTVKPINIMRRK